jgi:hypothetical protein
MLHLLPCLQSAGTALAIALPLTVEAVELYVAVILAGCVVVSFLRPPAALALCLPQPHTLTPPPFLMCRCCPRHCAAPHCGGRGAVRGSNPGCVFSPLLVS